eukprot:1160001-Pelagomonas_calceolata.AAC.3
MAGHVWDHSLYKQQLLLMQPDLTTKYTQLVQAQSDLQSAALGEMKHAHAMVPAQLTPILFRAVHAPICCALFRVFQCELCATCICTCSQGKSNIKLEAPCRKQIRKSSASAEDIPDYCRPSEGGSTRTAYPCSHK